VYNGYALQELSEVFINCSDKLKVLCFYVFFFSIEEFIPLLRERMNVLNPYVRQFLVGWITVLDSVPDIDMLGFLPDFLDGNPCSLFQI
jgi:hypothetical protein